MNGPALNDISLWVLDNCSSILFLSVAGQSKATGQFPKLQDLLYTFKVFKIANVYFML